MALDDSRESFRATQATLIAYAQQLSYDNIEVCYFDLTELAG